MEGSDDAHLLSILGVTAANPEDIERHVIAAVEEESNKRRKEGTGRRKKGVTNDAEGDRDIQDHVEDEDHSQESLLRIRLSALDQEIRAIESGLLSLREEENASADFEKTEDENGEDEGHKEDNKSEPLHMANNSTHGIFQGSYLQRTLGEERLASLEGKRAKLLQKLNILSQGDVHTAIDDDNDDGYQQIAGQDAGRLRRRKLVKLSNHKQNDTLLLEDDDELDSALGSSSGFVETERDQLIRTGLVTPFDCLEGFERRVEKASASHAINTSEAQSISDAAAAIAAAAKTRSRTKLLDASELPKLAPPTHEFCRIKKMQRFAVSEEKRVQSKGPTKNAKKRKRPRPESKWNNRAQIRNNDAIDSVNDRMECTSSGSEVGYGEESECMDDGNRLEEADVEDDVSLEGGLRIPSSIYDRLFDYQKTGVKWLWELHCQKAGGIIADEMGLGKTIQVVAFLASLHYSGLYKPSIVLCPVTLLRQWKREVQKWYKGFNVEILHDSVMPSERKSKKKKSKDDELSSDDEVDYSSDDSESARKVHTVSKQKYKWDTLINGVFNSTSGLLVTTYEQLRILREKLLDHEWGYAVLDEGHRIRNPDAEITLVCKQLQTVHRVIMTGAPIQNKLTELWSLFDFVFPGKLGVLPVFQAQFALPITIGGYANATAMQVSTAYRCAVVLRDLIMPYLLRRLKSDVNAHLTKKTEHVLFCSLTEEQRSAYRAFLSSSEVEQIFDGNRNSLYGIDILRKVCNHADLLEREHCGNHPDYGNPERSGKLKVLAQVLDVWKTQGHRVLVFTQTQQMLDIIETYIINKGFTYRRMDGSTPIRHRMALIDEFNESSHVFVFILTTKVGGLGTNLTGANKVIIFDPDWNPSTDMQARERAWRIGQTRNVTVYRLITQGTIEEKVYHRQIYKHFLTNKILRDPKQRRIFKARDMRDLFTLNEEIHESKTETSTLFAGLQNIELITEEEKVKLTHNSKKERDKKTAKDYDGSQDESRILECLFEANGIHSALNHDAIESMDDLEKMKVDNESAKVAQQAAAAVLQSRMQRSIDSVAVPTWTGRSGAAGAPVAVRKRFGSMPNARFLSSSMVGGSDSIQNAPGTSANVTNKAGAGIAGRYAGSLSSKELLAQIRGQAEDCTRIESITNDGKLPPEAIERASIVRQLRMFIEQNGGSVSSSLIVAEFKDILPASSLPLFRQLLKEIAVLRKEGMEGKWVLKDAHESANVDS